MAGNEDMSALLAGIRPGCRNKTGDIHINIIKNEFIVLDGQVVIPHFPVKEMDYDAALPVMRQLLDYIPEFLSGHVPLVRRRPAAEQHSVQVVRLVGGTFVDFVHLFTINLRYGGGEGGVIAMGDPGRYPSFRTDRVYYKSRLIPVRRDGNGFPEDFVPLRLIESVYTDSQQDFHTYAVFDDMDTKDVTRGIYGRMGLADVFSTSQDLYPFVTFDHFTACLNVPDPWPGRIEMACKIYEMLFIYIYGLYRDVSEIAPLEALAERLSFELVDGKLACNGFIREELRRWFARYAIARDDELALKGWWRIDCSE